MALTYNYTWEVPATFTIDSRTATKTKLNNNFTLIGTAITGIQSGVEDTFDDIFSKGILSGMTATVANLIATIAAGRALIGTAITYAGGTATVLASQTNASLYFCQDGTFTTTLPTTQSYMTYAIYSSDGSAITAWKVVAPRFLFTAAGGALVEYYGAAKAVTNALKITNKQVAADMDGTGSAIQFNQFYYHATTPTEADAARIVVATETDWTSTASTQDSYMSFEVALDGTVGEKMRITSSGNVGIQNTAPVAPIHVGTGASNNSTDAQILIARNVDDSDTGNAHAFSDSSDVTRGGVIGYNSFDARINMLGTADFDHFAGFQFSPDYASSGTIADIYGFASIPIVSAGTATNVYGLYVTDPTGAGTVVNNYGLYVGALDSGTTKNYGVYVLGATTSNYFAGNVGIGVVPPTHKLHITDTDTTASRAGINVLQSGIIVGTGYAGYFSKTGASTINVGLYSSASGAATNWAAILDGNVDINGELEVGSAFYANTQMLEFDGGDDNIAVGDITELNSVANFSISFWMKQDVTPASDAIFTKTLNATTYLTVTTVSSGTFRLTMYNGGAVSARYDYSAPMPQGNKYHVIITYDGAGVTNADKVKLYINGVAISWTVFSGTFPATTQNMATAIASIGAAASSFDGNLWDFRIYSETVSAANAAIIHLNGSYTTNMVHRWKLDELTGTVANDTGSNVMNGTISGATWAASTLGYNGAGTAFATTRISLPSSTTKDQGISAGDDTYFYRAGVGDWGLQGRLKIADNITSPTTSSYGITLGGAVAGTPDTAIYRSAADTIYTPDTFSIGGKLVTAGGVVGKITTVIDTYAALTSDETIICNKSTAFTVTLFPAVTATIGQKITIKNINTGSVTVRADTTGTADAIDGVATQVLGQWDSITLQVYAADAWCVI